MSHNRKEKKMKRRIWEKQSVQLLFLGVIGVPIGAMVGVIDVIFGKVLLQLTSIRQMQPIVLLPFLAVAGAWIVFSYSKFGGTSKKGMNLIFEVGHGQADNIPFRLIPLVISGTWFTHLFGGSAGREGVAVQIGATFSHCVGKKIPIENASHIFLITGMAAGFAGLFQTPIAAIVFAMEVLVAGRLQYQALFPACTAAFTANYVSKALGLEKFSYMLQMDLSFSGTLFLKLIVLGVIFGFVGAVFAKGLQWTKKMAGQYIQSPMMRIVIIGACISVLSLICHMGRYSGLGTNLISDSFHGESLFAYDWLLKLLFTVVTLAAGFQGGEVTPLFSIGASLGVILAGMFHLPIVFVAALGYVSVFGSATNTLFAAVFIGGEVFGYAYLPYFFIVCVVAYSFNGNHSIYSLQKL